MGVTSKMEETMSNTNESGFTPEQNNPNSFDLGPTPYTPTQPASQYVGPLPGQPPTPPVPPYAQAYSNYGSPAEPTQPYPPVPPYMQAQTFPPQQPYAQTPQYGVAPGMPLVPGQVVQTPYGVFTVGPKSKVAAGLLGIFLGCFGVGRFYRGHTGLGVAQLVVTILTGGFGWIWGLIDGIMVLVAQPGSPGSLDSNNQIMA